MTTRHDIEITKRTHRPTRRVCRIDGRLIESSRGGNVEMMRLMVNGKSEQLEAGATLADLLDRFDLAPIRVAVEVNRELVPRAEFDKAVLREGDQVEIVTFVGGG